MSSQHSSTTLIFACAASAATAAAVACLATRACKSAGNGALKKAGPRESRDIYESANSTRQYLEFHYTPSSDSYVRSLSDIRDAFDFPLRVARLFNTHRPAKTGVVLDLGCAVGASSFELAKSFDRVVGIDLSEMFIKFANDVKANRTFKFEAPEQGYRSVKRVARLPDEIDTSKVTFLVGDAMNVDPALGQFDGVLAANLLCRVPNPRQLLANFSTLIRQGGILVIASPYSWWEGATDKSTWIGGKEGDAPSEELAKAILAKEFELLDEHDEPFLIRDHCRRYQLGFSHTTVWRRK